jgi:hypothetical protein
MCFDHHIDKTSSKVFQRIGLLSRLKGVFSKKLLLFVYNAIIMPVFDYGSVVNGFTYSTHLKNLETLQKKGLKIICSADFRAQSRQIFRSLKVMPLFDRIKYNSFIFIFKSLNKLSYCFSQDFFKFVSHSRRTRSVTDQKLFIPNVRLTALKNSIFVTGVQFYNVRNVRN